MSNREIPDNVRLLLREHVTSYEHLEALLLLRSRADRNWSGDELASHLRIPPATAVEALDHLHHFDLVDLDGEPDRYIYAPANPDLAHAVEVLARVYETDRAALMNVMNASAIERLRTKAMRAFADAFIIRKKDKNG